MLNHESRSKSSYHCVKSVQMRSFFWSIFGHFSRSVPFSFHKRKAGYSDFKACYVLSGSRTIAPRGKLSPNPKTNPILDPNSNPNRGSVSLGGNCPDTILSMLYCYFNLVEANSKIKLFFYI